MTLFDILIEVSLSQPQLYLHVNEMVVSQSIIIMFGTFVNSTYN